MIVGDITELRILDVYDRGIPNKERIVISVDERTNMGQYGLMLGRRTQNGMAIPLQDHMFWFGDGIVLKNDFVFVYTGPGTAEKTQLPNSTGTVYSLHWGKQTTVLADPIILPILFRVDAVSIPLDPVNVPQLPTQT